VDETDTQQQANNHARPNTISTEEPPVIHDASLTDEERERMRADRAAAAEARLKKQGGLPKKKDTTPKPLVGPNSEPLMRWNMGS
jgi:hypothetical protein